MQELAPKGTDTPIGGCLSDEDLAAYIDGVLDEAEAARVTAHLADCEDCYAVYSGAARFLLESEPDRGEEGRVVRFPEAAAAAATPRPARWWAAAAAAVLVGGISSWYAYQTVILGPPPQLTVAEIAPDLRERPIQEILWGHNVFRGESDDGTELTRQSFQVGALLVDFHLSAQAGAANQASNVWRTIGKVTEKAGYMEELSTRIFSEANQISPEENPRGASKSLQAVAAQLGKTEEELRESPSLFPEYVDFGKWTEAGRIAAKTGDPTFFKDRQNRRFLSSALKKWDPDKPDEVRRQLKKIERIWDGGELDSNDFKALADHFQGILNQYEFLS